MTKFVITETLWSSIIFKTIMVLLHRGRFVVVHRCSSFPIDLRNFSRGANFYQKLPLLAIFGAVRPHFWSYSGEIWHEVRSWGSLPRQYIVKMALRGIPLVGKLYKKIPILSILGAVLQHFSTDSDTIWHEAANLGRPPQAKFCKNCLRGIPLLGKFIPKKIQISAIFAV